MVPMPNPLRLVAVDSNVALDFAQGIDDAAEEGQTFPFTFYLNDSEPNTVGTEP